MRVERRCTRQRRKSQESVVGEGARTSRLWMALLLEHSSVCVRRSRSTFFCLFVRLFRISLALSCSSLLQRFFSPAKKWIITKDRKKQNLSKPRQKPDCEDFQCATLCQPKFRSVCVSISKLKNTFSLIKLVVCRHRG